MNNTLLYYIRQYVAYHRLLDSEGKYIVALSGGADSVCLLLAMKEMGYHIEAAHCNFHLRGEESERDESFCERLCQQEGVPFHCIHFDTLEYASLHHVSIEMAARELRYSYFEHLRVDLDADGVCVAHHKDDSVETFFINLLRGTGIHGLMGISPKNGHIIRPLLCVGRKEIEQYLQDKKQTYVTDSTNLRDDVVRNKIRLNLLPVLSHINPSARDSILRTSSRLKEAVKLFDVGLASITKDCLISQEEDLLTIDFSKSRQYEYVLYHLLSPKGFSPSQIENIAKAEGSHTGKEWESATHVALIDRERLLVYPRVHHRRPMVIPEEGNYVFTKKESISFMSGEKDHNFRISKSPETVCLDAARVAFPLIIRFVEPGDRFVPFGMNGSKLVSDYMTDRKKSVYDKQRQLVVTDSKGEILWLVGERIANPYRITDETKKVLTIVYTCNQT
ncbi:MAG: tRNA lysidine(34) synthetase TilS [Prevotella sp.]|nr:tRNA lysidine(34) synthetase TilS [Prevotella sp.]